MIIKLGLEVDLCPSKYLALGPGECSGALQAGGAAALLQTLTLSCVFPQVMVPEVETRAGLTLKPQTFPLTVTNRPVMDVAFVQFLASVSGKVSCLGKMSFESKNRELQRSRQLEVGFW